MTNLDQKVAGQTSTELVIAYNKLTDGLYTYDQLLSRLESVGHKFKNTNYPTPELAQKEPQVVSPAEGFITDLDSQLIRLHRTNKRLEELVTKMESVI